MGCRTGVFVLFSVLSTASLVQAHHSFAPVYDDKRTITVDGTVTEFRFINPHCLMTMDVVDSSGKATKWTVEFSGRLNLAEGGWTEKSIQAGEKVSVTGNPTHTNSPRMFFRRLVKADGSELLPTGGQRAKTIEEVRRQRAAQRASQK